MSTPRTLWRLVRPRGAIWVVLLPLLGFGFAHWDYGLPLRSGGAMGGVLLAWAALHAGTMWLNAALDRDEGEVLFGSGGGVPERIGLFGYTALGTCVALAATLGPVPVVCAALAAVLAVLYSHPSTAWKGHPVGGPLVNAVGYGVLSPAIGWSLVDVPVTPRAVALLALVVAWTLGAYFAAQAFQAVEDGRRGYRTLVVTHGPAACLRAARVLLDVAFLGFVGLTLLGWFPRICLVVVPLGGWLDRWMVQWSGVPDGGSESWARGLAIRLVLVMLGLVGTAYLAYGVDVLRGGPAAGLGTARGHPSGWHEVRLQR